MEDGYYWVTPTGWMGEREIVELSGEDVYILGDDRVYKQNEFTNYIKVIREIPNPEDITIEEPDK